MKIIAVNISATKISMPILNATERAWILNINRAKSQKFVIGVSNNKIQECFELNDVLPDHLEPDRIKFDLKKCTSEKDKAIREYIAANKHGLKGFTTKYIP